MKLFSFRQDGQIRPSRYRTPSPPSDAVEVLSPPTSPEPGLEAPAQEWLTKSPLRFSSQRSQHTSDNKDPMRRRQSYPPQDTTSTFTSIAPSTTSGGKTHHITATPISHHAKPSDHESERPAKRARSEKLSSPQWFRMQSSATSRPATSYQSEADVRRKEAELLLNLRYSSQVIGTEHSKNSLHQRQHSTPSSSGQPTTWASHSRHLESYLDRQADTQMQYSPTNGGMLKPSQTGDATASDLSVLPVHELRHQLIDASKDVQLKMNPSPSEKDLGKYDWPSQQDSRIDYMESEAQSNDSVGPLKPQNTSDVQPKPDRSLDPPHTNQEHWIFASNYRPSMLATTIELSAVGLKIQSTQGFQDLGPIARLTDSPDNPQASHPSEVGVLSGPEPAVCAACKFTRNSMSADVDSGSTSWISCDGCKCWFHFACAGFRNEREVRAVDKYRCRKCKFIHGPTTYVRKSARAHTAIDYAGLNQGLVKTSDERPEHHYIKPIREGTINLQPENFARMRPELVTAEHFEKGNGMKEPIVIPAEFNPRPRSAPFHHSSITPPHGLTHSHIVVNDAIMSEDWFARDAESLNVPDHGQDALDMVIPHNLTVRMVAELYGPEEKVEVIDVKSQNGEGKKWNMRRWADYYENASNKVVRNVISLEVSQSTLGRLIRRPQLVRDLDLQDSVWPAELLAKGEFPRVQFYCLMSVADCFTDFHIDFGGSSVFYHILKGKKTFFFIPPKEKHLKKYEEWCMSPAQNWTFLGDQTKECYRVDLAEGDTMLIPAGWIHAVWTPEDSLVIGGNFLTRLNFSMQLRVAQIEKSTGVARKFRYPHFQKIQWYTAIRYLERDALPGNVRSALESGGVFHRQSPAYHEFDAWGENSKSGPENYHARYYSQPELEGLLDLTTYLLRTALIDAGEITDGITVETRNAVKKSIPRGFGEPLDIVRTFAIWCAWKRGNEPIPHWALPNAVPEVGMQESMAKLSAAAAGKNPDPETALQAPRRQSSRHQIQQPLNFQRSSEPRSEAQQRSTGSPSKNSGLNPSSDVNSMPGGSLTPYDSGLVDGVSEQQHETPVLTSFKKRKSLPGSGRGSQRKTACESCRKRRRACKHKTDPKPHDFPFSHPMPSVGFSQQVSLIPFLSARKPSPEASSMSPDPNITHSGEAAHGQTSRENILVDTGEKEDADELQVTTHTSGEDRAANISTQDIQQGTLRQVEASAGKQEPTMGASMTAQHALIQAPYRGRSKACHDCRKSKRRCLHDENGNEDPQKIQEAAAPRSGATAPKRRKLHGGLQDTPAHGRPGELVTPGNTLPTVDLLAPGGLPSHLGIEEHVAQALVVAQGQLVNGIPVEQEVSPTPQSQLQPSSQLNSVVDLMKPGPHPSTVEFKDTDAAPLLVSEHEASKAQATLVEPPDEGAQLDPTQHVSTTTPSSGTLNHKIPPRSEDIRILEEQPAALSLVSPPASSHDDLENPQILSVDSRHAYSSSSSSRRSSRHPTTQSQQHRFTPDSAPTRRDSSSSVAGVNDADTSPKPEEARTPTLSTAIETSTPSSSSPLTTDSTQKKMKARQGSEVRADEESLRLIRKLQAEEYGLRKRRAAVT
ncbi:MAG: hypothetical protein LQ352_004726 [Teloschistes flavicans]|nr:MAG: hypothetical protein LQ352_004726 [Teloschistes flavicans]